MLVKTQDNSNTLFSTKYNQHFHDVDTGAIKESLIKHVIPALDFHKEKKHLKILDICFGLGYNTFATINYVLENNLDISLEIYSPELDLELINSLKEFEYPKEFEKIKNIIDTTLSNHFYEDKKIKIELFIGDAREYVKSLNNLDIVYQDAFSSEVNSELWTVEYFKDIFNSTNKTAIVTTYSIASNVRLSLYKAGFEIYQIRPHKKKQTFAIKEKKDLNSECKYIDMVLKKQRNKELEALYDS